MTTTEPDNTKGVQQNKTLFEKWRLIYIGETGRRLRERFGEHLRSIHNRSLGLPVADYFNSTNYTIDDIRVRRVKQCSGSNTSRKRREMQLIFELGTLKAGGLNIDFSFI